MGAYIDNSPVVCHNNYGFGDEKVIRSRMMERTCISAYA